MEKYKFKWRTVLYIPQVTIYRIVCNLQFTKIRLLEIRSNNESKQSKGNHSQSSTTDQLLNSQAEDGKVRIIQNNVAFGRMQRKPIFGLALGACCYLVDV